MLADDTVQTVKHLLATTTLSQREIARRLGINRETVNRIAHDVRFDAAAHERAAAELESEHLVEPMRCQVCGGLVIVRPCQLCKVRKMIRDKTLLRRFVVRESEGVAELGLRVLAPHDCRYRVICARKIARSK